MTTLRRLCCNVSPEPKPESCINKCPPELIRYILSYLNMSDLESTLRIPLLRSSLLNQFSPNLVNELSQWMGSYMELLGYLLANNHQEEFRLLLQITKQVFSISVEIFCSIPKNVYTLIVQSIRNINCTELVLEDGTLYVYQYIAICEYLQQTVRHTIDIDLCYYAIVDATFTPSQLVTYPLGHVVNRLEDGILTGHYNFVNLVESLGNQNGAIVYGLKRRIYVNMPVATGYTPICWTSASNSD